MSVLRVLVVDDVELARQRIRRVLASLADVEVVGEAADGEAALMSIESSKPDVVILDIAMPVLDGVAAMRVMPSSIRPLIVFTTAHVEYALDAFRLEAVDYLLKPIDSESLCLAIDRVRRRLPRLRNGNDGTTVDSNDRLVVRTDGGLRVLPVASILWVESIRNYLALHCRDEAVIMRATLQGTLAELDPKGFARAHRSALVNLAVVREVRRQPGGEECAILDNGSTVAIGRRFRDDFVRRLSLT